MDHHKSNSLFEQDRHMVIPTDEGLCLASLFIRSLLLLKNWSPLGTSASISAGYHSCLLFILYFHLFISGFANHSLHLPVNSNGPSHLSFTYWFIFSGYRKSFSASSSQFKWTFPPLLYVLVYFQQISQIILCIFQSIQLALPTSPLRSGDTVEGFPACVWQFIVATAQSTVL
jgi:hypothetical protein